MEGYLGETPVESLVGTPFEDYGPAEWAIVYIGCYGKIPGDHHSRWVLDQIARILHGTPVEVKLARWKGGYEEYRFSTGTPSAEYLIWMEKQRGRYTPGEGFQYSYDTGVAP